MNNITGRSKHRRATRARRRSSRSRKDILASNISEVLGMSPNGAGDDDMATATALQRARSAAIQRHGNTPRPMSRMSWFASQAHKVPSPHASAMDWTLEVDAVDTDPDTDDDLGFADDSEEKDNGNYARYPDPDQDAEEHDPEPNPTQSDLDFIVDPVEDDDRDETYVRTDVDTDYEDDDADEELRLALLLSSGRLDRRQSWLAEQRINEIRYNLRPRHLVARRARREEKDSECELDEKEPDICPAEEPEYPAKGAKSVLRSKGELRLPHPSPRAEFQPKPIDFLTPIARHDTHRDQGP